MRNKCHAKRFIRAWMADFDPQTQYSRDMLVDLALTNDAHFGLKLFGGLSRKEVRSFLEGTIRTSETRAISSDYKDLLIVKNPSALPADRIYYIKNASRELMHLTLQQSPLDEECIELRLELPETEPDTPSPYLQPVTVHAVHANLNPLEFLGFKQFYLPPEIEFDLCCNYPEVLECKLYAIKMGAPIVVHTTLRPQYLGKTYTAMNGCNDENEIRNIIASLEILISRGKEWMQDQRWTMQWKHFY